MAVQNGPDQILKVDVNLLNLGRGWQFFYAKMKKDGRLRIARLTLFVLQGEKPGLAGIVLEITLEPT